MKWEMGGRDGRSLHVSISSMSVEEVIEAIEAGLGRRERIGEERGASSVLLFGVG